MAKKKPEITADLFSDTTVENTKEKAKKPKGRDPERKLISYRIGETIQGRINEEAARLNVDKSGLVRALLMHALDDLASGKWEIETEPVERPTRQVKM